MRGLGVNPTGDMGYFESVIGVLNLRQQIINAKLNPDSKAKFSDIYTLVENVSSLKTIFEKFTKERPVEFQNGGTQFPGQYLQGTKIIAFNMNQITNILQLAFTGGHEMLHLHDAYYINSSLRESFGINTVGTAAISLYGEYRSYTWMNNVGYQDSKGNSINVLRVVKHYSEQLNEETKSNIGTRAYEMMLQNLNILNNKYKIP